MKSSRKADGRAIDHRSLQSMRQQALKAVQNGQSVASVAAAFGVNVRSVFRWLADYAHGGDAALLAKPIPGRPRKVCPEEMRWLTQALRDHPPSHFAFHAGLWSPSLLQALVQQQLGKTLSMATAGRLIKALGLTPPKSPPCPQIWMKESYPVIRDGARLLGAAVYFADESSIRPAALATGRTAQDENASSPPALGMISVSSPQGETRFMLHEGALNAGIFCTFLERLLFGTAQPVFLIVDGHPVHKAKLVRDHIRKREGQLKLFFIPPTLPTPACSPPRASQERVPEALLED